MNKSKIAQYATYVIPTPGYLLVEILDSQQSSRFTVAVEVTPQRGRVLKVGKPTYRENIPKLIESPAEVGDIVIHSSVGYENITLKGEPMRIVPFSRVISVIKEKDYEKVQ